MVYNRVCIGTGYLFPHPEITRPACTLNFDRGTCIINIMVAYRSRWFITYSYDATSSMIKEHTEDWGEVAKVCTVLYEELNREEQREKSRHCVHTHAGITNNCWFFRRGEIRTASHNSALDIEGVRISLCSPHPLNKSLHDA